MLTAPSRETEKTGSMPPARKDPVIHGDVAFIAALALGIYMMAKCYAAAHYSLTTASALLTTSPVNVLLGSVTLYAYQLFAMLGLAGIWWSGRLIKTHGLTFVGVGVALCALLAIGLAPVRNVAETAGVYLVLVVGYLALKRYSTGRSWHERLPDTNQFVVALFVASALVIVATTLGRLWVPVEAVQLTPDRRGTPVVVGHVLSSDGTWTSVIRAGDRGVMRLSTTAIVARTLCHLGAVQPHAERPTWYALLDRAYDSPNRLCRRFVRTIPHSYVVAGSWPA